MRVTSRPIGFASSRHFEKGTPDDSRPLTSRMPRPRRRRVTNRQTQAPRQPHITPRAKCHSLSGPRLVTTDYGRGRRVHRTGR
ncbi:hypothetical protein EVAR_22791_1 [Eumeta japonica]|uniref:Uncharacterized protein n=1 Tax=Eumeta variegata TaxID=151549 RepID=A0A4C1VEN9_EUMVA|nr:hypothetical protein EVAR_22791_1 [Eumeta japonica]